MVSLIVAWACPLLLAPGAWAGEREPPAPPELPADPVLTEGTPLPSDPPPSSEPPPAPAARDLIAVGPAPDALTVSLSQAVGMALERNFNILGSADTLQTSRWRESATRAQLFLPKLTPAFRRSVATETSVGAREYSLSAVQTIPWLGGHLEATGSLATQLTDDPLRARGSGARLTLTQPLLRGFGPTATFNDLTLSRRSRENQERTFELARQSLAVDVTSAFYEVAKQRQLLAVARQSFERNQLLQRASEARMAAGLASKLDVYRAELQVSYAQDAMLTAETQLETALENFRVLLGRTPTDPLEPALVALDGNIEVQLEPMPVLVERALAHRLELVESRAQIDDARRNASLARQNLLPQLDVKLGLSRLGYGSTFTNSIRDNLDRQFHVEFTTSYPIERSGDRANKAVAELGVVAGQRNFNQRRLEVEAEVRAQVRNIERILKSVELQKKGVELAAQQHRLATLRYQHGVASNFDVVEAEDKLVSARASLVSLVTDYHVARVRLLKVTGTLDLTQEFRE